MDTRIGGTDFKRMLVDMAVMRAVQMTIVQEIDMSTVIEHGMAAINSVLVPCVIGMDHFMRKGSG